jgi:hypothetical protein
MSFAKQLLHAYPRKVDVDADLLAATIDALNDCTEACTADTDADLGDESVATMVACIRLGLDCADVCTATARVTSRPTAYNPRVSQPLLEACVAVCALCGDECERHADTHPHCQLCAQACRRCEQVCRDLLAATGRGSRR